ARSLNELRAFFSEDIRPRLIGMTYPVRTREQTQAPRQHEIEEFLREHNLEGAYWLALDGHADNFESDAPLILCNNEFGDREEALLRIAIRERHSRDPDLSEAFERGRAMKQQLLEQTGVLTVIDVATLLRVTPDVVNTLRLQRRIIEIGRAHV